MDNLEKAKKLRSVARALTTKLINKIESTLLTDIDENVISDLRESLEQLSVKSELLRQYDNEIEKIISKEDELENEILTSQEYQEKIVKYKCKIKEKIRKNTAENQSVNIHEHVNNSCSHESRLPDSRNLKLPKLTINKYYGDPTSFLEFWNQYESSIHNNDSLTSVDKFNYLKSLLGGIALNSVSGLSLTNENYSEAIKLLKDRFGREDLIINAHMNKILNLEPVKNPNNLIALRKLYDNIEIQVRNLNSLKVTTGSYGHLLSPILLKLIPESLTLEYTKRRRDKTQFDVNELLTFLQSEIECLETTQLLSNSNNKNIPTVKRYQRDTDSYKREKNSLYSSSTALTASVKRNCLFCECTEHESEKCSISLEEKKNKIKKRGLCFKCFRPNHLAKFCWRKNICSLCKQSTHNTLLCDKQNSKRVFNVTQSETKGQSNDAISTSVSTCSTNDLKPKSSVFLQTCTAVIFSNNKSKVIRILIDGGSHRSFVSKKLAKEFKLPVLKNENLQIHAFGENNSSMGNYECVKVNLKNQHDRNKRVAINALVVNQITGANVINIPSAWMKMRMKEMHLWYSDDNKLPIDMLIGAENYWEIVTGKIHRLSKRLVALETLFGITFQGQATLNSKFYSDVSVNKVIIGENKNTSDDIKALWELESMGIKDDYTSKIDDDVMETFKRNTYFKNGRYETKLIWDTNHKELSNNFEISKQRLMSNLKRLERDDWLYEEYKKILNEQLTEGIIEQCEIKNANSMKAAYYMPHHAVVRKEKSTSKVRIVYDASSKARNEVSLNDCLLAGPNLNPDLLSVLLRFRNYKVAFCADIKQAFLQISLAEEERNFLRFLWLNKDENLECLKVFRIARVGFGIKCSPFLLMATIRHHLTQYEAERPGVCKMLKTMYIDDLIYGSDSVKEALSLSTEAVEVMNEAHMQLRKWITNSDDLYKLWVKGKIDTLENLDDCKNVIKVLGIIWDNMEDIFKLDLNSALDSLKSCNPTKRQVLRIAAQLFDPLGAITPFTMRIKCLLQELWARGSDWDEKFDGDLKQKWDDWCSEVKQLSENSIPRYFFDMKSEISQDDIQMHVFSDSSLKAYGAVAFFRYATKMNEVKTSFIMSKSRIAPLKKITLPRMELLGALIAARMGNYIKNLFAVKHVFYWTDSTITLCWIKGLPSRWKQFVCNRVSEIQELTNPKDWRHCDGKTNPADLLTKGCSAKELIGNQRWNKGPEWLMRDENYWPKIRVTDKIDVEEESKKIDDAMLMNVVNVEEEMNILTKFSSWTKTQRIIALCLRFVANSLSSDRKFGFLTTEEITRASEIIIKKIQSLEFPSEIKCLESGKPINCHSKIISLNPFLDEKKLMRVGGRLKNANISENCKHPIILPRNNHITKLIIQYYHEKHLHGGVQLLLSAIRQNYWIVNAKIEIKKYIWKCIKCCRVKASTTSQIMADLPASRVVPSRTFSKIGIDFAGPFLVRPKSGRGVRPIKCYVSVFVCLVTKAIHLELVNDLTSEAFLAALKRFASRRGMPQEVISDCGSNFVGADKILRKIISTQCNPKLNNWILSQNIKWKFNPPGAPHHGGLWEAAVKSMKQHLRKTVGKQILTYEEFFTLICQVEACLNSRPLTPVSNDPNDISALTPGHFLIGTPLTAVPEQNLTEQKISPLKRWQLTQQMCQIFWKRWSREYLCQLQERYKWKLTKEDLKINDLVIIKEDNLSPLYWKLGRVIEVYPGADKKTRVVKLKTANGDFKRPITKLCLLPINSDI